MRVVIVSLIAVAIIGSALFTLIDDPSTAPSTNDSLAWHSFDAGFAEAARQQKKLLVDVYTDWCTWCKKMDKEVYTDNRIVNLLNESFVVVKLNAESSKKLTYNGQEFTEREFAAALGVDGYPTTVFFLPDAKPLMRIPGFMEARKFATVLAYIGRDHYLNISYDDFLLKQGSTQE